MSGADILSKVNSTHPIFAESEELAMHLAKLFDLPMHDASVRSSTCRTFCFLSLEHADALRALSSSSLITSAIVVLRSQFEALVRAVWVFYAASDKHLERLTAKLSLEHEQNAKNLPMVNDMLGDIAKIPEAAAPYQALIEFKTYSWGALNSYVHAGIHPLNRSLKGYPAELVIQFVKISNALTVISGMQVAILTGQQAIVHMLKDLDRPFANCLPVPKSPQAPSPPPTPPPSPSPDADSPVMPR